MSYYGGSIKNGVWSEDNGRYYHNDDCPDPNCYACEGKSSYWCGMVGCVASAKLSQSKTAQKQQWLQNQKEQRDKIVELAEAWADAKWSDGYDNAQNYVSTILEANDAEKAFKDYVSKIHDSVLYLGDFH